MTTPPPTAGRASIDALLDISSRIATSIDTDSLFRSILDQAVAMAGAEGGTIFFHNEAARTLEFKYVVSLNPHVSDRLTQMTIPVGSGIAGQVAETLQTDLVPDTRHDPRFNSEMDQRSGYQTQTALTVPLAFFDAERNRQTLVGVMQLVNKRGGGAFTAADASTLEALGGFAAAMLARASLSERLRQQFLGIIASLAEAVDAKDPYTAGHSRRVAAYAMELGRMIGLPPPQIFNLRIAALLHDIGKIAIPDAILRKKDVLTPDEFKIIQTHVTEGVRIVRPVKMAPEIAEGILHHHEKWDGTGYPEQRCGAGIPLFGRIIAFADAFDTITTERPYKKALGFNEARQRIRDAAGTHFDPELAEKFCRIYHEDVKYKE